MTQPQKERRPWPMKWIVVSILVFIPIYTYLTLHFRRPGPAFNPYQDLRDRTDVVRLLKAGYHRVAIDAQRPAESPATAGSSAAPAPGGLPDTLGKTLVETPLLPLEIDSVAAAPSASAAIDYQVAFTYTLSDNKRQLSGAHLYEREGEIVIVPDFERIAGELMARSRDGYVLLTLPPGTLKAGTYRVTLVGERASRQWTLSVR